MQSSDSAAACAGPLHWQASAASLQRIPTVLQIDDRRVQSSSLHHSKAKVRVVPLAEAESSLMQMHPMATMQRSCSRWYSVISRNSSADDSSSQKFKAIEQERSAAVIVFSSTQNKMYSPISVIQLTVTLVFGVALAFFPSPFLAQYNIQLDLSKPASQEVLTSYWMRTVGVLGTGIACLYMYALAYKINKFTTALLRVHTVMRLGAAYAIYAVALPWAAANKLETGPVTFQVYFETALAVLSLLGSLSVPADQPVGNKKRS